MLSCVYAATHAHGRAQVHLFRPPLAAAVWYGVLRRLVHYLAGCSKYFDNESHEPMVSKDMCDAKHLDNASSSFSTRCNDGRSGWHGLVEWHLGSLRLDSVKDSGL